MTLAEPTDHQFGAGVPCDVKRSGAATHLTDVGRLAVVLPAYNEEGAIASTIANVMTALPTFVADFIVIPVNDGSRDRTGAILTELRERYGARLSAVHNAVNRGYGGALRAGFDRALAEGADAVFFMDADGQFDIADLEPFLPQLKHYDGVCGYRVNRQDRAIRKVNAWAWKRLVSEIFDFRVRDLDCAFKLLRADFLRAATLHAEGAMINTELLAQFRQAKLHFVEMGVRHYPRLTGTPTGGHPAVIVRAFKELWLLSARIRNDPPRPVASVYRGGAKRRDDRELPGRLLGAMPLVQRALLAPLSARVAMSLLGIVVALSAVMHLLAVKTTSGAVFDIESYRIQADAVFQHVNVYTYTSRYPYPPVWVWLAAALDWLSTTLGIRFDAVVKLPSVAADLAMAPVMYKYARDRLGDCWLALVAAALFALNPITLLISAGHGQFDALVLLFVLLAITVRGRHQDRYVVVSALCLGVAIALKGYPVLMVPYLVLSAPWGKRILTGVVCVVPLVVSMVVYTVLFGYAPHMLDAVTGYSSPPDFGWEAILTDVFHRPTASTSHLLTISHMGIILFAVVVPGLLFRRRPATAITLIFSAFYAVTFTMSAQYILWVLPFLCLAFPVLTVVYSVVALAAVAGFYVTQQPGAIPHVWFLHKIMGVLMQHPHYGLVAFVAVAVLCVVYAVATTDVARAVAARIMPARGTRKLLLADVAD